MSLNMTRVRINGQAEMRDIVRTAIVESGLTQFEVAHRGGFKVSHLTGFLAGTTWLRRDALDGISEALGIPAADLIGGSIFKDDRHAFAEFDRTDGQQLTAAASDDDLREHGRTRALCCTCGTLRLCIPIGYTVNDFDDVDRHGRSAIRLHCRVCDTDTMHARLRLDDNRDVAERLDRAPSRAQISAADRDRLVERLAGFNVDVHYRMRGKKARKDGYLVSYSFDDAKSRWRIEVDPHLPPQVQIAAIEHMWTSISTDNHVGVDWDPRDGVVCNVTNTSADDYWGAAIDDLVHDLERFIGVEHQRLVLDLREEIAADQRAQEVDQ